tara:strand:+ start:2598 stop:2762 length:165 start_codon:yes stop_codon:yes gene_type:complete
MWYVLISLVILLAIFAYNFWIAINDMADFSIDIDADGLSQEMWKGHKILRRFKK